MNKILKETIKQRNGHYCHCIEISDVYELENLAESIITEWQERATESEIIEFLESLEVYSLDENNDSEIYDFSFTDYIQDTI